MSQRGFSGRSRAQRAAHGWGDALLTVLAALVVMAATAALGLWAAGAAGLPGGALPHVVAAVVVMAAGGSVALSGNAGDLARTHAEISVLPLSVTLAGALVMAAGFLRPLRHRAVAGGRELAGWAARVAVLWAFVLIGLSFLAGERFDIPLQDAGEADVGDLLGASPEVGFRTDVLLTLVLGLVWLAGILVLALLVSRSAPLPARLVRVQETVRPPAFAMVALLLGYVLVGLVVALVVAATRGHPAQTFAVILLGLPNLVWPAYTLGLGASWEGRADGPFGLPMPQLLDSVLRAPDISTVNVATLADRDGRAWWLVVVAVLFTLAAAFLMAVRSPARLRPWQHAVHMAVALVLTVLTICLVARVSAHYGLSLLGIGELGGALGAEVTLRPRLWSALAIAALWGLVTGFLGGVLASGVLRRGEVPADG